MAKHKVERASNAFKNPLLTPLVRALKEAFSRVSHRRPAHPPRRHAAAKAIRFEALEPRVLLSGDVNPAQTISGSIDIPGETDQYGFNLPQNARIVFDSLTNNPNLNWSLSGPAGTLVSNQALSAADGTAANPMLDLIAGDYTLTVDAPGDTTGNYSFRLIDLFRATELVPGSAVTGELNPANETDVYRFSATTGERFYFDFQKLTGSNVTWRLYTPAGRTVFGPDPISTEREYTAEMDGSYALVIEGAVANSTVASYSFNAQKIVDDVKPLVLGASQGTAPAWTAGQLGGAMLLDGGLQSVEVANSPTVDLTQSMTMEAWIKVDRFTDTWMPIFYKGTGDSNQRTYSMWVNSNGSVFASTSDASGQQSFQTAAGLVALNRWQHLAATINRATGQLRIYVDGVDSGGVAIRTAAGRSNTSPLLIGRHNETTATLGYFEGAIDEVRLWSVARTAAQIAASRNSELAGDEAGLAAYLKANEGSGERLLDATVNHNDAIVRPLYPSDSVVAGRIDHPGQRDFYTFTLADAKQLYFDSLTNNPAVTWSLLGPRGTVISNRPLSVADVLDPVPAPGTPILELVAGSYTLVIDASLDNTVPYAFRLLDLGQAPIVAPGAVVTGKLTPGKETDLYRFNADAGDRFYFDLISVSSGEAFWRLIDPFGKVVFDRSAFSADIGLRTLETTGLYTLMIEGRISSALPELSYSFNAQKIADEVKPLVLGESQGTQPNWTQGQLGDGLSIDSVQFVEVANSSTVDLTQSLTLEAWIKTDRFTDTWMPIFYKGTGVSSQRTYSVWLNANGSVFASTSDASGEQAYQTAAGLVSLNRWQHIAVSINRATGQLRIYIDGVDSGGGAIRTAAGRSNTSPLLLGRHTETTATLGYFEGAIDDVRLWSVARTAAQIAASRSNELLGTEAGLAVYLKANQEPGSQLTDASGHANQALVRSLPGDSVVDGRIDHPGQRDFYTFTLAEAKQLYFDSLTNNPSLTWSLVGPRGTVVSSRSFAASDSFDFGLGSPMLDLVAGSYTLIIGATGDTVARYAFRLLDLAQAPSVTPGTPVSSQLNPAKETDLYAFTANAGDQFFIDSLSASGGDTYWRLIDPYGQVIVDRTAMGTDLGLVTLANAGRYILLIEGRIGRSDIASYSFNVDPRGNVGVAPLPSGTAYTVGGTAAGVLATAAQQDTYRFTLAADARAYFDALTATAGLSWTLRGPRGTVVNARSFSLSDSVNGSSILDLVAGDYALTVTGAAAGYSFRLLDFAQAAAIVPSLPVTGTLSPANETDLYSFAANAGERFYFDFQSAANTLTYWRLVDPFGRTIFGPRQMVAASGDFDTTLEVTGNYTLLIEGQVGAGSGAAAYRFVAQRIADDVKPLVFGEASGVENRQWTTIPQSI